MIAIMRKILFLLIILLGFNFSNAQSKDLLVEYDTTYSCVNYDKNKLKIYKGGRRNIIPFFRRLERIINGKNEKINILGNVIVLLKNNYKVNVLLRFVLHKKNIYHKYIFYLR